MKKIILKIATLATAGIGVSGCTYDMGLGYASDGYYDDGYYNYDYNCDPYGGYDSYYQCDYGQGFYNIGFGGGWYDNYWYPGYGFYLFDKGGRRYTMRDNHRRYWGEKRHNWYRENRGRGRDGGRYEGRGRTYSDNATPGTLGWPERNGGRVRDGDDRRGRGDGQRKRNDQWRSGNGNGANAIPTANPDYVRGRGDGRRGDGEGRARQRGNDNANAVPRQNRAERPGDGGRGDNAQGNLRQRGPQPSSQNGAPATRAAPQPRGEGPRYEAARRVIGEGGAEKPD